MNDNCESWRTVELTDGELKRVITALQQRANRLEEPITEPLGDYRTLARRLSENNPDLYD